MSMNLAIEYLIRSGAIKNFFETPCSLFVDRNDGLTGKVVQIKEDPDRPDTYFISKIWHLDLKDGFDMMPHCEPNSVPKDQIFSHEKVILPNHRPIPFAEQPIPSRYNQYNSPIEESDYTYLTGSYLQTIKHRSVKKDWLWRWFMVLKFPHKARKDWHILTQHDKKYVIEEEQEYVKDRNKSAWNCWGMWKTELISNEKTAPELVFTPSYKLKNLEDTSS